VVPTRYFRHYVGMVACGPARALLPYRRATRFARAVASRSDTRNAAIASTSSAISGAISAPPTLISCVGRGVRDYDSISFLEGRFWRKK
jgi:hypothetical protein